MTAGPAVRLGASPCLLALAALLTLTAPHPWGGAATASPPSSDQIRAVVSQAAVRIEVEDAGFHGLCTGWVGWSEEGRSAAYTAGHCYRPGAYYRLTGIDGRAPVYAMSLSRWEHLDLMVLWFPRGMLPALRFWKPLPAGPFRALYVFTQRGGPQRVVDVDVARVWWEVRFYTHPAAVAVPLLSAPGTSGAPVVDLADGALVGMIVGYAADHPNLAAVLPAQSIYDTLLATPRR